MEILKRLKRAVLAWWQRQCVKCEARRAFCYDWIQFRDNAGALHLDRKAAACAEIVMGYHVLEKGLTMPHRRLGFGKGAVVHLINLIESFEQRFGDDPQVIHAIGVLSAYRELHRSADQHADDTILYQRLNAFLRAHPNVPTAVEPHVTKAEFFESKDAPFPAFAASRHVVRHFAGAVPKETVDAAVSLALTAPSACNRQPVRVHVIDSPELRDKLFALQGGARGFGADADKVIVVTSDLSSVRWSWERHDCYTNGGIFVMNLCYALHYYGVAHCILHWSVAPKTDRTVHGLLNIPANEAIVQVLACGLPPDTFDVAASPRRSLDEIVTWHCDAKG